MDNRKEWDINKLKTCFFPHDIEEIMKIKLSERVIKDYIAWHLERFGIFTVKSAYWLAVRLDQQQQYQTGQSRNADGCRSLYQKIWAAPVPQKVRVFAWKLSQEALATQLNWKHRSLTRVGTCDICGMDDENGHHATVRCTKAAALRAELKKVWHLPDEEQFQETGPDWLLILLNSKSKEVGAQILLLSVIHGKGSGSLVGSARFS